MAITVNPLELFTPVSCGSVALNIKVLYAAFWVLLPKVHLPIEMNGKFLKKIDKKRTYSCVFGAFFVTCPFLTDAKHTRKCSKNAYAFLPPFCNEAA